MKTAISIPDPVFKSAEKLRKKLRLSRSAFYARALDDLVRRYGGDPVTKKLNETYGPGGENSELEPAWEHAQSEAARES